MAELTSRPIINYRSTLNLIPFVSSSEDSYNSHSILPISSFKSELGGEEASQFYDSVISMPSTQQNKTFSKKKPKRSKKTSTSSSTETLNVKIDAIFRFAQEGNIELIKKCVSEGWSVDLQDAYGWTPLMCAACEGHYEVVLYLLKNGANPNIKCKTGFSPLDIAVKTKNEDLIKLLQEKVHSEDPSQPSCSSVEQSVEEKYCPSCKINYQVSTLTHERSIAHLFNNNKRKTSTFYHIPENNKGFQIMLKKGWDKDKGLGLNAEGRKYPIKTVLKKDRACIGKRKEVAKVSHFKSNDKAAINFRKYVPIKSVRQKTLKKWQRKKMEERSRQKEINFRRLFNCDF